MAARLRNGGKFSLKSLTFGHFLYKIVQKAFSFRGDPHQGLCPYTPLGAPPPNSRLGCSPWSPFGKSWIRHCWSKYNASTLLQFKCAKYHSITDVLLNLQLPIVLTLLRITFGMLLTLSGIRVIMTWLCTIETYIWTFLYTNVFLSVSTVYILSSVCLSFFTTYIRLLYGERGFFGPSSVRRGRNRIVLG